METQGPKLKHGERFVFVPDDFLEKVREMRAAQREFKEHMTYGYRNLAITLEKEVDKMLEEMDHES